MSNIRMYPVVVLLVVAGALSACATAQPAPPAPPPVQAPPGQTPPRAGPVTPSAPRISLAPPDAAVRTADKVQLTGRELGTMWTFENPPLEYWQKEYGFAPAKEWLESVRLASLRFGTYCSASFVSPDGLVMTNHHCARECVEQQSSPVNDYIARGFYARTRQEERLCEGLYLDQLVAIEDVTARVRSTLPAAAADSVIAAVIEQTGDQIERDCAQRTGNTCQVVTLFQGGQYQLYQYKRYQPVKLVFAPELQAGFFGGDPDNFTYPRYALDVSFVRVYDQSGAPAKTPNYFRWDIDGAAEKELVFVTGNPGSTSRLTTVAQVLYERVYRHPFYVQILSAQREMLQAYAEDPSVQNEVRQELFEVENSLKSYTGQLAGLRDSMLIAMKIRWEREFQSKIESNPDTRSSFGDIWDRIEELQYRKLEVSPRLNAANPRLLGAPHMAYAGELVNYTQQMGRPEAERSPQFRQTAARIRSMLEAPSPVTEEVAGITLRHHIAIADTWLAPDDPLRSLLLQPGETPAAAAARLAKTSRVLDAGFRKQIMDGGTSALETSADPLLIFVRKGMPMQQELMREWQAIQAAETVQKQRMAQALFSAYGTSLPPDATFTLRISDGRVQRYEYNGTFAPPITTYHGLYARAAEFGNEMPWQLPQAFEKAAKTINLTVPLNFVSTTDITGGNSGSPLIDQQGRIVGIAFDGNIEQLPNEFLFRTDTGGRTISVHSAGILEALRSVYGANALLRELTGQAGGAGGVRE